MKYIYPAIFKEDDGKTAVEVPDIPGCFTFGDDMADAMDMAKDVIEMMLVDYENNNKPIPAPSKISDIKTDGIISLIKADTIEWRKEFDNRSVKKTLSIPAWLNTRAEKASVNFSSVLQEALMQKLNIC